MYKPSTKKTTKKRNPTHWWSYEVGFIYQKFSRKQEYSYIWKKSEKYTFSVKFLLGGIKASVWDLKTSTRMKIQKEVHALLCHNISNPKEIAHKQFTPVVSLTEETEPPTPTQQWEEEVKV